MLSRSQFAEAAHVSKPAVTKAVTAGHLVLTDGKLDTDHPTNADFLARHFVKEAQRVTILPGPGNRSKEIKPPPKRKAAPLPHIDIGPPSSSSERRQGDTVSPPSGKGNERDPDGLLAQAVQSVGLDTTKKRAQISLMQSQTRRHDLYLAEKKNELIPRDLVRRKYSALDAALKTHLRDMPRRISAQVTALAASGGRPAVEKALEDEISAALARILQAAKEQDLST